MAALAIELDAAAVAAAPMLGYQIGELILDDDSTGSIKHLRLLQPWIESEKTAITIDVELFGECSPFDTLLGTDATTSAFVPSFSDALADLATLWDISPELHDQVQSSTPSDALFVFGGGIEALVWPDGMVIGTYEPFATALKLLIAGFSEQARRTYVYANAPALKAALDLLPAEVKANYFPEASKYSEQARRERTAENQSYLSRLARRRNFPQPK